jgi:dTDP-4-amino-4,6-dideoxygalactose transaminase
MPVFVDIEAPSRPHLSAADAEGKVTARTRAIMLMHYGGYVMDTAAWRRTADRHHAVLIEDAAHAAGLRGAGSLSDAACFSFFSNKNMTTGEGGMLIVRDSARRERARRLRSHGMTSSTLDRARGRAIGYDVVDCGHNFRMDELRAALGLVQLERLPEWNATRRRLTQAYRDALARCDAGVDLPFAAGHETAAHILPVLLPEGASRDEVAAKMRDAGVQTSMHYPPIHSFSYFRKKVPTPPLPCTAAFAARQMTIPLHPALTIDDVDYVAKSLARALHR